MRFARISSLQILFSMYQYLIVLIYENFLHYQRKASITKLSRRKKVYHWYRSCWNKVIGNKSWFAVICKMFWKHGIITCIFPLPLFQGTEFLLKCSFLEIYNEQIYDLMEPSTMTLHLRENMKKGVFVDRLTEISVSSALEAYEVSQP